jgi:hypothetical protein
VGETGETTFARWQVVHKPRLAAPRMHRKSGRQIGAAIWTCLDLLYLTHHPLASLTKTVDMLRQMGWRADDVRRVEHIARKALHLPPADSPLDKAA